MCLALESAFFCEGLLAGTSLEMTKFENVISKGQIFQRYIQQFAAGLAWWRGVDMETMAEIIRGGFPGENRGQNYLLCLCYLSLTSAKLKVSKPFQIKNILHNSRSAELHIICTTAILTAFVIIMGLLDCTLMKTQRNMILILDMSKF